MLKGTRARAANDGGNTGNRMYVTFSLPAPFPPHKKRALNWKGGGGGWNILWISPLNLLYCFHFSFYSSYIQGAKVGTTPLFVINNQASFLCLSLNKNEFNCAPLAPPTPVRPASQNFCARDARGSKAACPNWLKGREKTWGKSNSPGFYYICV